MTAVTRRRYRSAKGEPPGWCASGAPWRMRIDLGYGKPPHKPTEMLCLLSTMVIMAQPWDFAAKIVPLVVGGVGIAVCVISLFNDMCRKPAVHATESLVESAQHEVEQKIHMDLASDTEHLPVDIIVKRAARFFGYLIAFMGVMAVIGLVPTVGLFVVESRGRQH